MIELGPPCRGGLAPFEGGSGWDGLPGKWVGVEIFGFFFSSFSFWKLIFESREDSRQGKKRGGGRYFPAM